MVLAIEPMVNWARPAVKVLADGWTAVTRDGSLSAHFEHTVAVTADGPLVLTRAEHGRRGRRSAASDRVIRLQSTVSCAERCRTRCAELAIDGRGR